MNSTRPIHCGSGVDLAEPLTVRLTGQNTRCSRPWRPEAVRPSRNGSDHLNPITGAEFVGLRPGLGQSRAPPPIGAPQRLGAERAAGAPVLAGQHLHEAFAPGLECGLPEFGRRVLPVDLADDDQVARIDVYAFGSAQAGKVASIQVCLQAMTGHLGYTFDVVESPAPALVRMEAEVVQPAFQPLATDGRTQLRRMKFARGCRAMNAVERFNCTGVSKGRT